MASIEDVAKKCGVSIATVSRVFNRRGNVREKTRDKVVKVAQALGYNPKLTARRDCIALVVEHLDEVKFGGYNALLVSALTREVIGAGYHLEIVRPTDLAVLREKFVCGVISLLYGAESLALLEQAHELPIVTINSVVKGIPAVVSNDAQGIRLTMEHLVELGHRRIGLRAWGDETFSTESRIKAFQTVGEELGLAAADCIVESSRGNQTECLAKMLQGGPTAIIACGESTGMSVAHSLRLLGRGVPEDLSLAGFEYAGVSQFLAPPQTTIAQDFDRLASEAMTIVKAMESGELAHDSSMCLDVDYKLRVRESTAPPPSGS